MFQRTLPSAAIVVCVVDHDASALKSTIEVLSSTGYEIRPFRDRDTFLNVEEQMPPALAVAAGIPVNLVYRQCTGEHCGRQ